jgi:energy-coupling factor transporter transmembrane protein EcfT
MLGIVPMGLGTLAQTLAALRVNSKLISILYLTHRYIYLLRDTVFCSVQAMRLRQNPQAKGILFTWKAYAAVFAAALAAALKSSEDVSAALRQRGFDGAVPQTRIYHWRVCDTILVTLTFLCVIIYGTYTAYKHFIFV